MLSLQRQKKEEKNVRDTISVYFLDSVTLNFKFSFTDEYIKVLPAYINRYITRLSRPSSKISEKVKSAAFTTEGY